MKEKIVIDEKEALFEIAVYHAVVGSSLFSFIESKGLTKELKAYVGDNPMEKISERDTQIICSRIFEEMMDRCSVKNTNPKPDRKVEA